MTWLGAKLGWNTDPNSAPMPDFTDLSYLTSTTTQTLATGQNQASQPHPKATLTNFCLAIRDFEGVPGDRNYRNNNPGNVRYYEGGYLPQYLPVLKDKDGFAIFKDYDTGFTYLKNMLQARIHLHPEQTILQFMSVYAPASDNNPVKQYATFIANRLGVDIGYKVGDIVLV